jgi:tetratricopeptide (TPR) repeat protein
MQERPVDTIDDGVFVYRGVFDTSLASAFGYYTRASNSLANKQLDAALNAAEQAVAINPNLMQGQIVLGDTFAALHRDQESADAYNKALSIAQHMEPSAQADWTATLKTRMAALHL